MAAITSPLVKQVAHVIQELQGAQFAKYRIELEVPDEKQAKAIAHLFEISMPAVDEYVLTFENGRIGFITTAQVEKIDQAFFNKFKIGLLYHAVRLASPWKDASDDIATRVFYEIQDGIPIYTRVSKKGSEALYETLDRENGGKVAMTGFHADVLYGQKSDVQSFFDYLKSVEKEFQQMMEINLPAES